MKQEPFSFSKRLRSFQFAFQGIVTLLRDEHNSRVHVCVMAAVIIVGILLGVSPSEWCIVIICFGMVLAAEAMNTAVEAIADLVMPERHPLIKKAKDIAAAGVLFTAIAAAAAGLIIFIPYILKLIL